jgi:hypothetical protein
MSGNGMRSPRRSSTRAIPLILSAAALVSPAMAADGGSPPNLSGQRGRDMLFLEPPPSGPRHVYLNVRHPENPTPSWQGHSPLRGAALSIQIQPRRGCKWSLRWRMKASSPRPGRDGLPIVASSATTGRKRSARRARTFSGRTLRFPQRTRRISEHAGEGAGGFLPRCPRACSRKQPTSCV